MLAPRPLKHPSQARHPLQRLASPARSFSALLHVVGLLSFSGSWAYLRLVPNPHHEGVGGPFVYLTVIGLATATATFALGLLADLTLSQALFRCKNRVSVCSTPLELLISILYWGLRAIDRDLVVPPDASLGLMADCGFHAVPTAMLAIDLLLLSPPWTVRRYGVVALSTSMAFMYWAWIEYCFSHDSVYPYPLFARLETWQRALLFGVSALLMTGSASMLKWVYGQVNGIEEFKREALNPIKAE